MQVQMFKEQYAKFQPCVAVAFYAASSIEQPLCKYWLEATINVYVDSARWLSKHSMVSEVLRF